MKLLFVHGAEKIKEDMNGELYTSGSYNSNVWDRYLTIANELTVLFRKDPLIYKTINAQKKFNYFDKNKINFKEIPDIRSGISAYINAKKRKKRKEILKKAVKDNDLLIVRLPSSEGNIAVKYAKKYNKPYLVEVVGCPWDAIWNHSFKGKFLAFPSYHAMRKSVQDAPYVLYVSSEFLQNRYPTKGKNLGCSDVVLPSLNDTILEKRLKKIKLSSLEEPIILGTTAAVDIRYKGQEYVIKAIAELKKEGYNFEYHLAGGGNNTYLKKLAEKHNVDEKIKFLGSLPHNEVFTYLDSIDIYIQPSKQEGLPRALVEAMSRGCPSLGANTGGIPELLNNEFIFSNGSIKQICEQIKKLDKETMIKEAKRSFKKSKEFDKEKLNQRRMAFYSKFAYNAKNNSR